MTFDPHTYLLKTGQKADGEINLLYSALAFCARLHPDIVVERYQNHAARMIVDVQGRYNELVASGATADGFTQLAALKHIFCDREGYIGTQETPNPIQDSDMMRVIDRRKGGATALSLLCVHVGRAIGWDIDGIDFPERFICRMQKESARILFDPSQACRVLDAHDLRLLLKSHLGDQAELLASYYTPCTNRGIVLHLQNELKIQFLGDEQYKEALCLVKDMQLFALEEGRLWLDEGVLMAKLEQYNESLAVLERYKATLPKQDQAPIERLIYEIRLLSTR